MQVQHISGRNDQDQTDGPSIGGGCAVYRHANVTFIGPNRLVLVNPSSTLIIEDIDTTLTWLISIAREVFPDTRILTAETLADARTIWRRENPDLTLLDLGLPDGSGLELLREMDSQSYVVVTTIFDDDEKLRDALRLGANGYLLKDDEREELVQNLRSLTQNRPPFSTRTLKKMMGQYQPDEEQSALTSREEDVLRLIAKGFKVNETAEMLGLTANTVKGYLKSIYGKLNISSRAEATSEAIKRNLILP